MWETFTRLRPGEWVPIKKRGGLIMRRRTEEYSIFTKRLREVRSSTGMSQNQVAEALGVSRSAYAYYETGATRPDLETLIRIARVFGVTTDYLLGLEEVSHPKSKVSRAQTTGYSIGHSTRPHLAGVLSMLEAEEQNVLIQFRQMDAEQKSRLFTYALALLSEQFEPEKPTK